MNYNIYIYIIELYITINNINEIIVYYYLMLIKLIFNLFYTIVLKLKFTF